MGEISFGCLDFDRVPIERESVSGCLYTWWLHVGMPRIPDNILSCCFFCYGSAEDAEKGVNPRGTGFIVAHHEGLMKPYSYYAVSNWHVVCKAGASVIRLNRKDGGVEIVDLDSSQWEFDPNKSDVAVASIELLKGNQAPSFIPTTIFAAERDIATPGHRKLFVGDDTFMIGLFADHHAANKILPAARFGHISMLPDKEALAVQPNGYEGVCFVVDMRSRSGFSGSPVFSFRTFGSDLGDGMDSKVHSNVLLHYHFKPGEAELRGYVEGRDASVPIRNQLKLIGIQCAQFPEPWILKDGKVRLPNAENNAGPLQPKYIEGLSGMTLVVPAWEIRELLDMDVFQKQRKAKQAVFDASARAESVPPASDVNPTHREDFNRLLGVAARTPPQGD